MRKKYLPIKIYLKKLVDEGMIASINAGLIDLANATGYTYDHIKHVAYGIDPLTLPVCNRLIQVTPLRYKELMPELYLKIMDEAKK